MHEMRTIATDVPVAWCAILSVTQLSCAKRLNGSRSCLGWRHLGPRNTVLSGVPTPYGEEEGWGNFAKRSQATF